jgi:hypothetical protein
MCCCVVGCCIQSCKKTGTEQGCMPKMRRRDPNFWRNFDLQNCALPIPPTTLKKSYERMHYLIICSHLFMSGYLVFSPFRWRQSNVKSLIFEKLMQGFLKVQLENGLQSHHLNPECYYFCKTAPFIVVVAFQ